jgi:hypothetical protein
MVDLVAQGGTQLPQFSGSMDAAVWAGVAMYAIKSALEAVAVRRGVTGKRQPDLPLPCAQHAEQIRALNENLGLLRDGQVRIEMKLDRMIERALERQSGIDVRA